MMMHFREAQRQNRSESPTGLPHLARLTFDNMLHVSAPSQAYTAVNATRVCLHHIDNFVQVVLALGYSCLGLVQGSEKGDVAMSLFTLRVDAGWVHMHSVVAGEAQGS